MVWAARCGSGHAGVLGAAREEFLVGEKLGLHVRDGVAEVS